MAPTGDEWVSQAVRRAGLDHCVDRQIRIRSVCACVCVILAICAIFAREQVCRRRLHAGVQGRA